MSELDVLATKFGHSEPVYVLNTIDRYDDQGATRMELVLKNPYDPDSETRDLDPVMQLLAGAYSETFNSRTGAFESCIDLKRVYDNILAMCTKVLANVSPLKNPKQSKLYNWMSNYEGKYNDPSAVGFIALYRYIYVNNVVATRNKSDPHAKNFIAILELMREKYEGKKSSN